MAATIPKSCLLEIAEHIHRYADTLNWRPGTSDSDRNTAIDPRMVRIDIACEELIYWLFRVTGHPGLGKEWSAAHQHELLYRTEFIRGTCDSDRREVVDFTPES